MPQHGFFRNNLWTVGREYDNDDESCCEFNISLGQVTAARGGPWAEGTVFDFDAVFTVKINASHMTNTLTVKNTGGESFPFQALYHTYYSVDDAKALDPSVCNVEGLTGYNVEDKVTGEKYVQGEEAIIFGKEVDRIYNDASKLTLDVVLNAGKKISLKASASVDGVAIPVSAVVWNPYIEKSKATGDFGDEEYKEMVCVEPGIFKDVPILETGKEAIFEQVVSVQ